MKLGLGICFYICLDAPSSISCELTKNWVCKGSCSQCPEAQHPCTAQHPGQLRYACSGRWARSQIMASQSSLDGMLCFLSGQNPSGDLGLMVPGYAYEQSAKRKTCRLLSFVPTRCSWVLLQYQGRLWVLTQSPLADRYTCSGSATLPASNTGRCYKRQCEARNFAASKNERGKECTVPS